MSGGGKNNAALGWWANRKSRMGLQPSAKPPPHLPDGRDWWCAPPTAPPEPSHIEYVTLFYNTLLVAKDKNKLQLQLMTRAWLIEAKRLFHERRQAPGRADLATTDGLIIEASRALGAMIGLLVSFGHGDKVREHTREVEAALFGKSEEIRRRRALDPAHPIRRTARPVP